MYLPDLNSGVLYTHFPSELLSFGYIRDDFDEYTRLTKGRGKILHLVRGFLNMEEVTLPVCRYIGVESFVYCRNLRAIHCPEMLLVRARVFSGCSKLEVVDMPKRVIVETGGFAGCRVKNLVLPACREIGNYAFSGCTRLRKLDLPQCTKIGHDAIPHSNNHARVKVNAPLCDKG